jgi:apolipoprotein N-acyltransferase
MPTVYARFGDTPMLLLSAALVLISLRRRRSPA